MSHYVYILKCQNGRFYVGYTTKLEERLKKHEFGYGSKFAKDFGVKQIVYHETFTDKWSALRREKQLKGWSHSKKKALIENNQPLLKELSISRSSPRKR